MYDMTLKDIFKKFPTERDALLFVEELFWDGTPECPYCHSHSFTSLKDNKRYKCNSCNNTYSVMVGTVFHRTKCDLRKWLLAIYLYEYTKPPLTSRALSELINVTKDTAWLMLSKIRKYNVTSDTLFDRIRSQLSIK